MTNFNEAAYWLALVNQSGLGLPKLKPMVQKWVLMEGKSIVDLFDLSLMNLRVRFELQEEEAQGVLKSAETHQAHLHRIEQWAADDIHLLTLNHSHYPVRLIYNLPPQQQPLLLWAKGNIEKLLSPTLTILGQEDPDQEIKNFVTELAPFLVDEDIGVVSGYGKGLDRHAFETILDTKSGYALAVLPMGLSAFSKLTTRLDPAVTSGQAILVSPFAPDMAYNETLADARNLLVDSLALALIAPQVDAALLPRTLAALDRGMPVLVSMIDSPENRTLIANGAFLLTDFGEVIEMVQQAMIDDSMQAQLAHATPAVTSPPVDYPSTLLNDTDDYAIRSVEVDPIAPDEALDILSSMGTVPDSLRSRLMAMEKMQQEEDDELM